MQSGHLKPYIPDSFSFGQLGSSHARRPQLTPEEHAGLTLADHDEIRKSLSFALRFDGRKRVHWADEHMSSITADHLIRYLERSGYVVMKKPPSPTAWVSAHPTIPMKE